MAISDPIADLLTRIRNAARAKHRFIDVRHTKMKGHIVRILQKQGFVDRILIDEEQRKMRVFLRYDGREPLVSELVRLSSPGLRRYIGYRKIPRIDGGMGLVIVSTPLGVMDGETAREQKVGGELLCIVR